MAQIAPVPIRPSPRIAAAIAFYNRHFTIESITLAMYLTRDATAGAARYYLNILKLDPLWFLPDLMAFLCVATFIRRYILRGQSALASVVLFYSGFALILGYVFLGTVPALASSLKMFAPVFVGFCFCGRRIDSYPWLLRLTRGLFYLSVAGVIASAYVKLPWVGYAYETFGAKREAGRVWWSAQQLRLSGFAADSTMAAFFIMMMFVFSSIKARIWWVLAWGGVALYATNLTTNKTALGTLAIYIAALLAVRMLPEQLRFSAIRSISLASFSVIAIPFVLIVVLSGVDLTSISSSLFSIQDRINNSWQKPFVYMIDLMPIGYLTGCGLGCFNYPQLLFAPQTLRYYVPVDNWYLGTYLMMGLPFGAFMALVIHRMRSSTDVYKLTIAFVMNIFTITVLSYGPASGLVLTCLAFSDVFARSTQRQAFVSGSSRRVIFGWRTPVRSVGLARARPEAAR